MAETAAFPYETRLNVLHGPLEIVDVKADTTVLSQDGLPDIFKLRPIVYDTAHRAYHGVGPSLGEAFSVGKK